MAAEGDVKRRSLVSVDSGVSVVSLEGGSRDSLAVADDASSLTSASSGSLLSLPTLKGSPSQHSLDSQEGTDSVLESPRDQLLAVWPKKCAFIVEEILQTENAYFTSLNEIVKGYMNPLYFVEGLDQVDAVEGVFGNIQDLHKLHDRFLTALQSAATERIAFALAFREYAEEFQEKYSVYCTQHPKAMQRLQKVMESKEATEFFGKCQRSLGHPLPLSSLLLKPVQRILRYKLLLEKLQDAATKTLQDQEACTAIQDALTEMAKIADEINQRKKEYEIMQDVQANMTGWSGGDLSQYGKLLLEDTLKVVGCRSERLVLLLEELLLLLKKKESKYLYKQHILVRRMIVQDRGMNGEANAICVCEQHNLKDVTVLLFSNMARKQEWLDTLMKVLLGSITAAKGTADLRPEALAPPRRRSKGIATSPLTKAKRRKKYAPSAKEKVSVAEFLMQLTESPPAPRREGGMWRKRGSKDVAKTLPNAGSRESTTSPEPPRPRVDSWSPEAQLQPTAVDAFNPLLDLEDSFESSFEMSRNMDQHPGATHVSLPPSSLERSLTVRDVVLRLGEDVTYSNVLPTSTPVGQRGTVVATSAQVTPTTCSVAISPLPATAIVANTVSGAASSPSLRTQRNTSYLEAVTCEKEKEGGYLSSSSGDVFHGDSDEVSTDTDSDEEIVISYGGSPAKVPRSPLVRQKPLEKVHGARVRRRYGSSSSSVPESSEGSLTAADERDTCPVPQNTVPVTQMLTTSAEEAGTLASPDVDVSSSDCKMNDVEEGLPPLSGLAGLEQRGISSVAGTTVPLKDSSCKDNSKEVSQFDPFLLRRQGSVRKLIANFEKSQATSEVSSPSQQRKASEADKLTAMDSLSGFPKSAQHQLSPPPPPGEQTESLRSESIMTELVANAVEQSEGPSIKLPLRPVQKRDLGSVKMLAMQSRKLQKRKSSERSEAEESQHSSIIQGLTTGDNAGLSSPKKAKLLPMADSQSSPQKILQLEDSSNLPTYEGATHQHSQPIPPTSLWEPSSDEHRDVLSVNSPGTQASDDVTAESPLVDTQSHFLPVRQRAQVLSRVKGGVEHMAHRTESVQVIERQRKGSVSKISHYFEALQEGSSRPAAEGTDSSNIAQEQQTSLPDVVGMDLVSAAHQRITQDIPWDDTEIESSTKGLQESEAYRAENGVKSIATDQKSISEGDCRHPDADIDGSSEDTSSSSQVQATLMWTSAVTAPSQSPTPSVSHTVVAGSDVQPRTDSLHEQVELDTQSSVQHSPPPSPGYTSSASQPEPGDVKSRELPCGQYTEDVHTTSTPQVEDDGSHAYGTVSPTLTMATNVQERVALMDSAESSSTATIRTLLVHESAVVDVQCNELASCAEGIPDGHGASTVAGEQVGEVLSTQVHLVLSDNTDHREMHQPSSLTSTPTQSGDIQTTSSDVQVNDSKDDQQRNHMHKDDLKLDDKETVEVEMDEVQTGDAQIEAARTDDLHFDDVQTVDMQWDDIETKQVDENSTVARVTTLMQESKGMQTSIVCAQSVGETVEEVPLVYEATSLVLLPRKHRESEGMIDVQFKCVPTSEEEIPVGAAAEQECHNVNVIPEAVSVADCADKTEINQCLLLSDPGVQGTPLVSHSRGGVEMSSGPNNSTPCHVTGVSTKSHPADCPTQPPAVLSNTGLPPVVISAQRGEKVSDDKDPEKDNSVVYSAPLNGGVSGREGVKKQLFASAQQTVHTPVLEGSQGALESVADDCIMAHIDHTRTPTTEYLEDSAAHAVSDLSVKDIHQNLRSSQPVYGSSHLRPSGADVVSGPVVSDTSALNTEVQPTRTTNLYSSHYSGVDSRQDHRWEQSEEWGSGSKRGDGRQYQVQGRSLYEHKSPCPTPPTAWDRYSLAQQSGQGDRTQPTHAYYHSYHHGHTHHGDGFGSPHHGQPLQRNNPVSFTANGDLSNDANKWGTPYCSGDYHRNTGQMQESRPLPQVDAEDTAGVRSGYGQVESADQQYRELPPLARPVTQHREANARRKSASETEKEWQELSSQVRSTQASADDVTSPMDHFHGNKTCKASAAAEPPQPHLSASVDSNSTTSEGRSRFETQFSSCSVESKPTWPTCDSTVLVEGQSSSRHMSLSSLNSDGLGEGTIEWSAGKVVEERHGPAPGHSGVTPGELSPQGLDVQAAGPNRSAEHFSHKSAEVALKLDTSVWEDGEANGLSLSPTKAVQAQLPPVKVTPRHPSRHKLAASGHAKYEGLGLQHTDTKSHLPLFHAPRGGNTRSKTKLLLFLLFVVVVVFMGLQVFVGEVEWMQPF